MDVSRYAAHSPYSDPRHHAPLLAAVAPDPASLHAAVNHAVVHYRAGETAPTPAQCADVDRRWVASILDAATERAPGAPLAATRPADAQVGGCCRDHSLLAVAVLREHGVPARTRLGFADYLGRTGSTTTTSWWNGTTAHGGSGPTPRSRPTASRSTRSTCRRARGPRSRPRPRPGRRTAPGGATSPTTVPAPTCPG
ncbi:hypothetical protein CBR64_06300 [Cellulosimicrobium cellulans]|uniref:Transglutaminase-like domain-containing protein n=1 Tax=Cellulosimicrobium cellulans TaxID=1710 RepID=A0A1Y0HT66_CELCE|nr:hypothetical protein CBR64_06300 [Cellulosimicrobium cellulans]